MCKLLTLFPLTTLLFVGCATTSTLEEAEMEEEISLDQVPANVLAAARSAVPGINLTSAEIETNEDGTQHYELDGIVGKGEYEVEVSPSGEVLEVESPEDEE